MSDSVKPKFDPNQAFTPADSKPPFDPNAPHSAVPPQPSQPQSLMDRLKDPDRLKALFFNKGPYATPMADDGMGAATAAIPIEAVPAGLAKLAMTLSQSKLGRAAANTGVGAIQGALNNPDSPGKGALMGGAAGAGLSGLSEATAGASKWAADRLMQGAVGLRKYYPGLGNKLADMGLIGTKGMLRNQVDSKLSAAENQLQDLVKDIPGTVPSSEVADAIAQKAKKFQLSSTGKPSPFSKGDSEMAKNLINEVSQMGDLSAQDLLEIKRQADNRAWTTAGNPATSSESGLNRAGANGARTALKNLDPSTGDILSTEQALVRAKTPLNKPDTIHQGMGSKAIFGNLPGSTAAGSALSQLLQQGVSKPASLFSQPWVVQPLVKKLTDEE